MYNPGETNATEFEYAGFWLRAVAYIIDMIILGVATVPINVIAFFAIGMVTGTQAEKDNATFMIMTIACALCTVAAMFYFSIFESLAPQATPGKMVMKLEVTDGNFKRVSFARALVRNTAKLLSGMFFNVGYIMAGFTGRKQALHDVMAGCLVVKQHPSKETKWAAAHHKHKTGWKDHKNTDTSAPKNIAASGRSAAITAATTGSDDLSKINLAEVAARPVPAGAPREPAHSKLQVEATPNSPPPTAIPGQLKEANAPIASAPQTAPQSDSGQMANIGSSPAFLQADLSAFSSQPSVPSDLGSVPSTTSVKDDSSQKVCTKCGADIDPNFSFCLRCMETH